MAQACSNPRVARATTRDREISNGQLRLAYECRYFMVKQDMMHPATVYVSA